MRRVRGGTGERVLPRSAGGAKSWARILDVEMTRGIRTASFQATSRRIAFGCVSLSVACGADEAQRSVLVEQTANGPRTTVVTTRMEPPPLAPPPADPLPGDPLVQFNLEILNQYREHEGVEPLRYSARISAFAIEGSKELALTHVPRADFAQRADGAPGFGVRAGENQSDPDGIPPLAADPLVSGKKQIEETLKLMYDESHGGKHFDNIVNPRFRRVGVGLYPSGGRLDLTNDFSD